MGCGTCFDSYKIDRYGFKTTGYLPICRCTLTVSSIVHLGSPSWPGPCYLRNGGEREPLTNSHKQRLNKQHIYVEKARYKIYEWYQF